MPEKATKPACTHRPVMEQKYKDNPRSFWMRVWKWHSGWCPGHQAYLKSLEAEGGKTGT